MTVSFTSVYVLLFGCFVFAPCYSVGYNGLFGTWGLWDGNVPLELLVRLAFSFSFVPGVGSFGISGRVMDGVSGDGDGWVHNL